jgi:hypothetical protein
MNLDYDVDFSGWERVQSGYAYRLENLQPVHDEIGNFLIPEVKSNIETSGGAEPWQPLKPATLTKERLKYGTKPNLKTGELLRSIDKVTTDAYCDVGSQLEKSKTLFFTYARSPFKWQPGVMDRVSAMYMKHLFGGLIR